jgi:RNA polymerase sigma-70 factor (ECF subfamily)
LPEFTARLKHLDGCLEKLPADQRLMIDGYYFRQVGIEAVAREARRTVAAVYKSLQRIRQSLQQCIESSIRTEETT